jgi:hypothetical protein
MAGGRIGRVQAGHAFVVAVAVDDVDDDDDDDADDERHKTRVKNESQRQITEQDNKHEDAVARTQETYWYGTA